MINKALEQFKESTGFDFLELLNDKDKLQDFYESNDYENLQDYLEEAKTTLARIEEIKDDLFSKERGE